MISVIKAKIEEARTEATPLFVFERDLMRCFDSVPAYWQEMCWERYKDTDCHNKLLDS